MEESQERDAEESQERDAEESRERDAEESRPSGAEEAEENAPERTDRSDTGEKTAEELEAEENEPEPTGESDTKRLTDALERESEPLLQGDAIASPVGPLPVRSLTAMAVMVAVSVVAYLAAWGLLGTVGLLLGWIPASALGFLAAREVGRRVGS
jgi:hypothetical protein